MKPHLKNGLFYNYLTAVLAKGPEFIPELYYNRDYRTELYDDKEHFLEFVRNVQFDKFVNKYHMTGTAYGQPLRDALDHTEYYDLEYFK